YNVSNMQLIQALHTLKSQADYALVFRSDLISPEALSILRNKADTLVAYQWDGLKRFPEVFKRIPLFDRFFVFDKYDYEAYKSSYENISLTTNFYFDQFPRKSEQ